MVELKAPRPIVIAGLIELGINLTSFWAGLLTQRKIDQEKDGLTLTGGLAGTGVAAGTFLSLNAIALLVGYSKLQNFLSMALPEDMA